MRVFVAVELPEEIKNQIAVVQNELKKTPAQVSWVKPGNIHVTLKFLGEIEEAKIEDVFSAAETGCQGVKKFRMSLKGLGGFPNLNKPRVIWVGTASGEKELSELQKRIESELEKTGFPRENRRFAAHFTIGRIRFPKAIEQLAEKVENTDFASSEFYVEQVVVMQSQLDPAGSIYTPLKKIPLQD